MNDVAADADPYTGAAVYDSYNYGGWVEVGGTSLSAPLIAAVYALGASASSWTYPAQSVYGSPGSLHDVTSGSDGTCVDYLQCNADTGYDLPTGMGTPNGLGAFGASPTADTTPPAIEPPTATIVAPQTLGTTAIVSETWSASDVSGIASYEFQVKKGSGAWTPVSLGSATATGVDLALKVGTFYRLRVRATDGVGNVSSWATTNSVKLRLIQENSAAITFTGSWKRAWKTGASGGKVEYAVASGAKAKLTFTGASASFVTTVSAGRGICQVWVDGSLVETIDTYAATTTTKRIVFATPLLTYGSHTIEIRVTGTKRSASTSPRIDVDAFLTWP